MENYLLVFHKIIGNISKLQKKKKKLARLCDWCVNILGGREGRKGTTLSFKRYLYFSLALFYLYNLVFWFSFFFVWIIALLLVLWHWVTVLLGGWQPNLLADGSPHKRRGAFFLPSDSKSFWVDRRGLILSEERQKQKGGVRFLPE